MRIHHVAMAVYDMDDALDYMRTLGANVVSDRYKDLEQDVCVCFVDLGGQMIELVSPLSERSPVMGSIKAKRRLYHLCYEVDDLDAATEEWTGRGAVMVSEPKPAVAFDGRKVVFFLTREGDLFELLAAS